MTPHRIRIGLAALAAFVLLGGVSVVPAAPQASSPPLAPEGLTAISPRQQGHAGLAPVDGRDLLRAVPRDLGRHDHPARHPRRLHRHDVHRHDRHERHHLLLRGPRQHRRAQSASAQRATATPRGAACSTGNRIVVENCFPGTTAWKSLGASSCVPERHRRLPVRLQRRRRWQRRPARDDRRLGRSLPRRDLPDRALRRHAGPPGVDDPRPDRRARLLRHVARYHRPHRLHRHGPHVDDLHDRRLGVRRLPLQARARRQRPVQRGDAVVRDDGGTSDVLYGVPTTTYQAYNDYGGKSVYSYNSNPPTTVSDRDRAVQVSFDRPYAQPAGDTNAHDWYTRTDLATVSWLEQQGYDTTLHRVRGPAHRRRPAAPTTRSSSPAPTTSTGRRRCSTPSSAARDAGTSLIFSGANAVYWRVRFLPSPVSGVANRVMVGYKTIESGPADPSGHSTSTFRDPAGPNQPENAADRPDVHRRQNRATTSRCGCPRPRARTASGATRALNNLAAGTSASDRHEDRRLGVGRARSTTASSRPACRRARPRP